MKTPLAIVRGLGSAKTGTRHWWQQRVSALALVPLTTWFLASIPGLADVNYQTALVWLRHPLTASLLLLFVIFLFSHFRLGVRVVVEDYIHQAHIKLTVLALLNAFVWILGLLTTLSILRIFMVV